MENEQQQALESDDTRYRNFIKALVSEHKKLYWYEHKTYPKFLKFPLDDLSRLFNMPEVCCDHVKFMFEGLEVCPTISIKTINEIEVF